MPFNPALPANGSQILSAELRSQFTSLKTLIDSQAAQIAALQTQTATFRNEAQIIALIHTNSAALPGNDVNQEDGFSDPVESAQVQNFANVYNTLVSQLRRE